MCYILGQWLSNPNWIFQMNRSVQWYVFICTHLKTNTAGNKGNTRASSTKLMERHQYQHCRREPFYETIDSSAFCTTTKMKHISKHSRKEIYLILRQTEEHTKSGRKMKHYLTKWEKNVGEEWLFWLKVYSLNEWILTVLLLITTSSWWRSLWTWMFQILCDGTFFLLSTDSSDFFILFYFLLHMLPKYV